MIIHMEDVTVQVQVYQITEWQDPLGIIPVVVIHQGVWMIGNTLTVIIWQLILTGLIILVQSP